MSAVITVTLAGTSASDWRKRVGVKTIGRSASNGEVSAARTVGVYAVKNNEQQNE
jgi:hypothetical protein